MMKECPYSLADCLAHIGHITSAVLYRHQIRCWQRKGSKLLETSATIFIGTETSCSSHTDRRERDGARTASNVIHQLGHRWLSVGGGRKEYCSVSAKLNWKG